MAISFKSQKARSVLNVIFSVGAAVVIFGALAKIEHWGGIWDHALEVGMLTETFVFLLMALTPAEKEYHWERLFKDITLSPEEEKRLRGSYQPTYLSLAGAAGTPALGSMDKMLQEADITPTNLKRLSENFQKLGTTVEKMHDVADVVTVTGDFTQKTRETSAALDKMRQAYTSAAEAVHAFNSSADASRQFHDQIQQMTKNLASLNALYELELQDTNNHLKAMNHFYSNLASASESMAGSVEDAKNAQAQIGLLARNLGNLNTIYGSMLSAMQGRA